MILLLGFYFDYSSNPKCKVSINRINNTQLAIFTRSNHNKLGITHISLQIKNKRIAISNSKSTLILLTASNSRIRLFKTKFNRVTMKSILEALSLKK